MRALFLQPLCSILTKSSSYKDDFKRHHNQYQAQRKIFLQAPASASDDGIVELRDQIDLIAHVASCYPDITSEFSQELTELLTLHHAELESELREKIVGSLGLLRRKDVIDSSAYIRFPLNLPVISLTTSPAYCKHFSQFSRQRRASLSVHCCSRRSLPT